MRPPANGTWTVAGVVSEIGTTLSRVADLSRDGPTIDYELVGEVMTATLAVWRDA